jgi:ribosomal protein S18 acetylase RimI-like enzyme
MTDAASASEPRQPPAVLLAGPEHLDRLVDCHMASLVGRPITDMGRSFVRAHLRYFLEHPEGICLAVTDESASCVAGFVLGGAPAVRRSFVRRHFVRFALTVLGRAFLSANVRMRLTLPIRWLLRRIVGRLRGRRDQAARQMPPDEPTDQYVSLLFLGVRPNYQRRGIATALLDAFGHSSARGGFQMICVSTEIDNDSAIRLYAKAGYEETHRSDRNVYFRLRLPAPVA